jgi:hypothetical protein
MKRLFFALIVILILAGCGKPPIPEKLIAYQRVISVSDKGVAIIAYDLAVRPYRSYLYISDMQNNISYEKVLGDSVMFTDACDDGTSSYVLLKERDGFRSKLMKFDYSGRLIKEKTFNIEGIELRMLPDNNLIIGGQTAENEAGFVLIKPDWEIIITSVLPGTDYRSCTVVNEEPYFAVFSQIDNKCSIYTSNNESIYSYPCTDSNPAHLTTRENLLRFHWMDSSAGIHVLEFDSDLKVSDETLLPSEKGVNFSVVERTDDSYYSILMQDKEKGGIAGTRIFKLSENNFSEIKVPEVNSMTLASFYQRGNNLMLCFFSLERQGNHNGFSIIK